MMCDVREDGGDLGIGVAGGVEESVRLLGGENFCKRDDSEIGHLLLLFEDGGHGGFEERKQDYRMIFVGDGSHAAAVGKQCQI